MRIGFDIDGVFYKFTKAYHLWLNQNRGMSLSLDDEALTWDWFLEWETKEQFSQNLHESVDAGHMYWTGDSYEPQVAHNLRELRAAGHTIHFVTARTFGKTSCPLAATEHWLASQAYIYDSLTVSKDKTSVKTDLFIEDNVKNYDALEAAGVVSYLINRPYNDFQDNRRRVDTVDEFTGLILENAWQSLDSYSAY